MFDRIRRSTTTTVDAERLKAQAADVGSTLAEASAQAGAAAAVLAEQAREAAHQARLWATPRVEKALRDGAHAAQPKVERAAEKSLPLVETAHDKLVQDLLPKLVAAVEAAAVAAAAGADKARDVTSAKLTEMAHLDVPEPKKSRTGATIFWVFAGAAAAGAAYAAWRSSRPMNDPWAEQPWEPVEGGSSSHLRTGVASDVRFGAGEAAEAVGEAAGGAVAKTREAGERAKEAREKVAERAREATDKAREASKKAAPRRRASSSDDSSTDTSSSTTGPVTSPSAADAETTAALPLPGEATPADLDGAGSEDRPGS